MLPLRDDEEALMARLETRVGQLANLLQSLTKRCEQTEKELRGVREERDSAAGQVPALNIEISKLHDEITAMRAKQLDAATRVRSLLEQIDRLGLFDQKQES
jgi:chromosome segregation ATPase